MLEPVTARDCERRVAFARQVAIQTVSAGSPVMSGGVVQGDRSSEFCVRDLDSANRIRTNAISTNGQRHVTQCIIIVGTIGLLQNP